MPEMAQQPAPAAQEHDDERIALAFHDNMTLREMKASFSSNALTRLSNQVRVRVESFVAIKSPASATQLNEAYNKFLANCDFLYRAAH